ncbi:hypothetical protein SAMN04488128_1021568 [Chitinophaga eiseniae]|uniref:N,N-dimethylformamidase beta subunit-like C-terminal domain-containing protein n=1 Tax=Chitinophaga eiseniae TaxID=634771 RepID=A0A1T4RX92_9BACT|nr:N,N-dimethylformamidase beta subunit family domain-containing protein [Chitinophaga eiseniae]SKA20517.1 hypothetical protein SAMN04488128_1021568 [Chitinophaga eiseniae]
MKHCYLIGLFIAVNLLSSCTKVGLEDAEESQKPPGNTIELDSRSLLNGYPDKQSYFPGDSAKIYMSTANVYKNKLLYVYDLAGNVVHKINVSVTKPQDPRGDSPSEMGFGYTEPVAFKVPDIKSGVYLLAKKIPIVIKTTGHPDITIVYPSNTENAYCTSGRRSLYTVPAAKKVSFLRPIPYTFYGAGFFAWIEKQPYSYGVIADVDMEDYNNFKGKLVVFPGHNEYWTRKARRNFDRFVDNGNHALILSGNTMWWQTSYNAGLNQMGCYKYSGEPIHTPDSLKTINWPEKSLKYQPIHSIGCDFNRGGYGNNGQGKGWHGFKVMTPGSPLFKGLSLAKGDIIPCRSVEYDGAPLLGFAADGDPIIDAAMLQFHKVELTAFDHGFRVKGTVATSMVFKKTVHSGTVINFPSTNWCTAESFRQGPIPRITKNAIDGLLTNQDMFSK